MKKVLLAFALLLPPSVFLPIPAPAQSVTVAYSLAISPAQASLSASGTQQFSAPLTSSGGSVAGSLPSVVWSVSPAVGNVSASGLYTAPATISAEQTVLVTATAGPMIASAVVTLAPASTASLSATYSMTVSPAKASLVASATQQFTAPISSSVAFASPAVTWSINPSVGAVSASGIYTAPASISAAETVTVTATSGTLVSSATVALAPPAVTLPIQIMGSNGTIKSVTFNIPSGTSVSGQLQLQMQIHNLKYETEASVQVNGGSWIPINTPNTTRQGLADVFGGIGGGFATLGLTMNLPAGSIAVGTNTLTFEFVATNGVTSGYSVLAFNILGAGGAQLLPASTFAYDNPATWQPPLNDPADIQAGQALWQTATLNSPMAIKAHCSDCHTYDGRDLKYFNYSNYAIEARSEFHGLTATQGQQIASYIRSLNAPAPANAAPWNPPYQPGPGLHSQPVTNWAAGAGLGAVVASDEAMVANAMPNGSTAAWAQAAYFDQENYPIYFQLLDWNRWLPTVHPMDAFGAAFTSSALSAQYAGIRAALLAAGPVQSNIASAYLGSGPGGINGIYWDKWIQNENALLNPLATSTSMATAAFQAEYYSAHQWVMVKLWELNQQFALEQYAQAVNASIESGARAPITQLNTDRAWFGNVAFHTSPTITGMPRPSAGIGNGLAITEIYHSFAWYQLQLILNDGGTSPATQTVDWPYAISFLENDIPWNGSSPRVGTAGLLIEWMAKALQGDPINPEQNPSQFVGFPAQVSSWSDVPAAQKTAIMTAYTQAWFAYFGAMTPAQLQAWIAVGASVGALPFTADPTQTSFGQDLIYGLPQLAYQGVTPALLTQIATWAATVWPSYPWATDLAEPCAAGNLGQVKCAAPAYTAPAN
jgi:hypothetical protein